MGLTITALAALGRSTTPPEAVEAVVEKVRTGERPTVNEVKATIKEAKAKRKPKRPSYIPTQEAKPITPTPTPKAIGKAPDSEVEGAPPMVRRGVPGGSVRTSQSRRIARRRAYSSLN